MTLDKMKERKKGKVTSIQGDNHFISRITAIGLTMGSEVMVVQNHKKHPILLYCRDTVIAINREECAKISMEVMDK